MKNNNNTIYTWVLLFYSTEVVVDLNIWKKIKRYCSIVINSFRKLLFFQLTLCSLPVPYYICTFVPSWTRMRITSESDTTRDEVIHYSHITYNRLLLRNVYMDLISRCPPTPVTAVILYYYFIIRSNYIYNIGKKTRLWRRQ